MAHSCVPFLIFYSEKTLDNFAKQVYNIYTIEKLRLLYGAAHRFVLCSLVFSITKPATPPRFHTRWRGGCCLFRCFYQAPFLIKCDPIAEDRVIVILKFFRILPVFDLVKGRCAVFGHCILCAGILRLKNSDAISLRVKDDHIAAPFSMLLIGVHLIARSGKNTG